MAENSDFNLANIEDKLRSVKTRKDAAPISEIMGKTPINNPIKQTWLEYVTNAVSTLKSLQEVLDFPWGVIGWKINDSWIFGVNDNARQLNPAEKELDKLFKSKVKELYQLYVNSNLTFDEANDLFRLEIIDGNRALNKLVEVSMVAINETGDIDELWNIISGLEKSKILSIEDKHMKSMPIHYRHKPFRHIIVGNAKIREALATRSEYFYLKDAKECKSMYDAIDTLYKYPAFRFYKDNLVSKIDKIKKTWK
jgi:hypothetical protein